MGLFGGFKAKFTRNATVKKQPEVVCLRYHVHAEFDNPDVQTPPRINDVKKTEVTRNQSKKRERKAITKSAIFPDSHTSQSSLSSSTPQKSLSLNNLNKETSSPVAARQENGYADSIKPITVSTTVTVNNGNGIAISDTKFGKNTEEHNGVITEKVAMVTNNHVYSTNNNVKSEQHSQTAFQSVSFYDEDKTLVNGAEYTSNSEISFLKRSRTPNGSIRENGHKNLDSDQSTLIFMTQHSSRSSSFDRSMETNDIDFSKTEHSVDSNRVQENFNRTTQNEEGTLTFVPNHAASDDEADYFKVNVVRHDLIRTDSVSEDERSFQEEVQEPRFVRMGFSSQAASIFFGDGEEPEVVRPRRIQFTEDDEDDERRSSGADC